MKYYDKEKKRLIYFSDRNVGKDFWDNHWQRYKGIIEDPINYFNPKSLVCKITQKFLKPKDGVILEGGCGLGDKVLSLKKLNYNVIGIDNAVETIKILQKKFPEIPFENGDVSALNFSDNFFSGYWSLGVIEHFINGYYEIMKEMYRVIKPDGCLFLSFPYLSPIRLFKIKIHQYPFFNNNSFNSKGISKKFYQFAFNKKIIIEDFEKIGFKLLYKSKEDGIRGYNEENFLFTKIIIKFFEVINNYRNHRILGKFWRFIDKLLCIFSAHTVLLVFQKKKV